MNHDDIILLLSGTVYACMHVQDVHVHVQDAHVQDVHVHVQDAIVHACMHACTIASCTCTCTSCTCASCTCTCTSCTCMHAYTVPLNNNIMSSWFIVDSNQ